MAWRPVVVAAVVAAEMMAAVSGEMRYAYADLSKEVGPRVLVAIVQGWVAALGRVAGMYLRQCEEVAELVQVQG